MTKLFYSETKLPYLILIIVTLVSIYPFFYMISTSFMTVGEATNQYLFPKKLMFENYIQVWTSSNFQRYTLNSLIISSIIVLAYCLLVFLQLIHLQELIFLLKIQFFIL